MSREQATWAKRHDWFVSSYDGHDQDGWVVCAQCDVVYADGTVGTECEVFTDYQSMRNWAGY